MTTKAEGQIRINGVTVGEVSISLLGPSVGMAVKYALCNVETGEKFGMGNRNQSWSEATLAKLSDLLACIEADVVDDVFVEPVITSGIVSDQNVYPSDGVPGL